MTGKTVVVLGGGFGGTVAASELRKRLGKEHRVVLVDKDGRHIFWPSLLWLQVGLRKPDSFVRDLSTLQRKGIEVMKKRVEAIDPKRKAVRFDGSELVADYLVISLGAELAPERIPGLAREGHNLYTLEGATAIRDARKGMTRGDLVVLVAGTPFKCPPAPYEAAMLQEYDLRKRKVRDTVAISLYSPEPGPMALAGPEVSAGVRRLVEERGIAYHPLHQATGVDGASKTIRFADGSQAHYDLLIAIPPHVAPAAVRDGGLASGSGWVAVDRETMETGFPDVFAVGDVTGIPLPVGLPLPKAGVFAHREAEAVAQTIAARILGKGEPGTFDGRGECFIEVGGGKAGIGRGNFYADPRPEMALHQPTRYWHAAKVLFEKDWLRKWF